MIAGTIQLDLPPPFRAVIHEVLPSTSDVAKAMAEAGAAHGTLVWAGQQSSGRGRLDRNWVSPPGNLYMSAVLRPNVSPGRAAELGFVAALAVGDCVASFVPAGVAVALKWPNDVLLEDRKIAGILLETRSTAVGAIDWLVVGIGINIASSPESTPYPTASLKDALSDPPQVADVLTRLCGDLGAWLAIWSNQGFGPTRAAFLARVRGRGGMIELRGTGGTIAGRFEDLDQDGALILETAAGRQRITAGDVHFPGR